MQILFCSTCIMCMPHTEFQVFSSIAYDYLEAGILCPLEIEQKYLNKREYLGLKNALISLEWRGYIITTDHEDKILIKPLGYHYMEEKHVFCMTARKNE